MTISGISLTTTKLRNPYGIHQSSWNTVYAKCLFTGYENESSLIRSIENDTVGTYMRDIYQREANFFGVYRDVKKGEELVSCWNFRDIGYFVVEKGFFSDTPYIRCTNCGKGKINGKFLVEIAQIKVLKETAIVSNPRNNEVLSIYYTLWSIQVDVKCDTCNKHILWDNMSRGDYSWNANRYADSFSIIK